MMKRLLHLVVAVLALFLLFSCTELEDSQLFKPEQNGAFKIGDKRYATLQAAVDSLKSTSRAAEPEEYTIVLLMDFTDTGAVISDIQGKRLTIDFGNFTYTIANSNSGITNDGNNEGVTFKGGKIKAGSGNTAQALIKVGGDTTVDGTTIDSTAASDMDTIDARSGSLDFKGDTDVKSSEGRNAVSATGSATVNVVSADVKIKGGLELSGNAEVNLEKGTIILTSLDIDESSEALLTKTEDIDIKIEITDETEKLEIIAKVEEIHIHSFSDEWTSDSIYHWHAASCGHSAIKEKSEHSWNNGEVTTAPTCATTGVKTYTCTVCHATRTETVAKVDHTWDGGVVTTEPTCTEEGVKTFTCAVCGETRTEAVPATGHSYSDSWTGDETNHWHASTCGHDVSSGLEAHSWDNGKITTAPTCATTGVKTYTCTVCHATRTETVAKVDHTWNGGVVTTEPTCTEEGVRTFTCTVCGETRTEAVPATGHSYSESWAHDATNHWHDSACGHDVQSGIAAHSWNNGEITTSPTCVSTGVKTYTCTVCNATRTETVAKVNHTWSGWVVTAEPTCTEDGVRTITCTVCGETRTEALPATGHQYLYNWTVRIEPTTENEGLEFNTCSICGNEVTRVIPRNQFPGTYRSVQVDHGLALMTSLVFSAEKYQEISDVFISNLNEAQEYLISILNDRDNLLRNFDYSVTEEEIRNMDEEDILSIVMRVFGKSLYHPIAVSGEPRSYRIESDGAAIIRAYGNQSLRATISGNYLTLEFNQPEGGPIMIPQESEFSMFVDYYGGELLGGEWCEPERVGFPASIEEYFRIGNIPSHSHEWGNRTIAVPLSIEADGIRQRICSECGAIEPELITYSSLFYIDKDRGGLIKWANVDIQDSIVIPEAIEGTPVTGVGVGAFEGCDAIVNITLPATITSIRENAFQRCSNLSSISIPDGVTQIGYWAFKDCSGLEEITIPDSVTSIGHSAFENCTGIKSLIIPDSVTSIGDGAFSGCTGLESVTSSFVGDNAFSGCTSLSEVTLTNSVTSIGLGAFQECSGITSITIPNSVTRIGGSAFGGCSGLVSITIPNSVASIGRAAFIECSGLKNVVIPASVSRIEDGTFAGCSDLLTVSIPSSVTSIDYGAFRFCSSLTDLVIPNSVETIGDYLFEDCVNLETITIGSGVTKIGFDIFKGCTNLSEIRYVGTQAQWDSIDKAGWDRSLNSSCRIVFISNDALQFIGSFSSENEYDEAGFAEVTTMVFSETQYQMQIDYRITDIDRARESLILDLTGRNGIIENFDYSLTESRIRSMGEEEIKIHLAKTRMHSSHLPVAIDGLFDYSIDDEGIAHLRNSRTAEVSNGKLLYHWPDSYATMYTREMARDAVAKPFTDFYGSDLDHEHDWSEYVTVISPSENTLGVKQRTCQCGAIDARRIPLSYDQFIGMFSNTYNENGISYVTSLVLNVDQYQIVNDVRVADIDEAKNYLVSILNDRRETVSNFDYSMTESEIRNMDEQEILSVITKTVGNTLYHPIAVTEPRDYIFESNSSVRLDDCYGYPNVIARFNWNGLELELSSGQRKEMTREANYELRYYNYWGGELAGFTNTTIGFPVTTEDYFRTEKPIFHNHVWGEYDTVIPSTEQTKGVKQRICSTCGGIESQIIPTHVHSLSDWFVRAEATTVSAGEEYRVCSFCGYEETRVIPRINPFVGSFSKEETSSLLGITKKTTLVFSDGEYQMIIDYEVTNHDESNLDVAKSYFIGLLNDMDNLTPNFDYRLRESDILAMGEADILSMAARVASSSSSAHFAKHEPMDYSINDDSSTDILFDGDEITAKVIDGYVLECDYGQGRKEVFQKDSDTASFMEYSSWIDFSNHDHQWGEYSFIPELSQRHFGILEQRYCLTCDAIEARFDSEDYSRIYNVDRFGTLTAKEGIGLPPQIRIPNMVNGKIVLSVGRDAFKDHMELVSIEIPEGIQIVPGAFNGCLALRELIVSETNMEYKSVDGVLYSKSGELLIRMPSGLWYQEYTIDNSVQRIGGYAFEGCMIQQLIIPQSVTAIEESAFEGSKIVEISIPQSVSFIGRKAFYACPNLNSIIVDNQNGYYSSTDGCLLSKEGDVLYCVPGGKTGAFEIPEGVRTIGLYSISGPNLTSVSIPDSVDYIDYYAFDSCGMESIVIPDSVIEIKDNAFSNCENLETVTIGLGLNDLGSCVFDGCDNLAEIRFEGTEDFLTTMHSKADDWDGGLNSSCELVFSKPFIGSFTNRRIDNGIAYDTYLVFSEEEVQLVKDINITNINSARNYLISILNDREHLVWDFDYSITVSEIMNLTEDEISSIIARLEWQSESVPIAFSEPFSYNSGYDRYSGTFVFHTIDQTHAQGYVFYINGSLSGDTLHFSDNINDIHELTRDFDTKSFCNYYGHELVSCEHHWGLRTIVYSDSDDLPCIRQMVCETCGAIRPELIEYSDLFDIDEQGLIRPSGNLDRSQERVVIPGSIDGKTVTGIAGNAFWEWQNLKSVSIPDSVVSIGDSAFRHCTSLVDISIPDSVVTIEEGAFGYCTSLASISIPENVTSIGDDAFASCTSLSSITLPQSVTSLGRWVFVDCTNLCDVTILSDVSGLVESFRGCTNLKSVELSSSITSIGTWTFYGCDSLEHIELPASVTTIEDYAFEFCGLTEITIPVSVTTIGENAFARCQNLSEIRYLGTSEQWAAVEKDDNWSDYLPYDCHVLFLGEFNGTWATAPELVAPEEYGLSRVIYAVCDDTHFQLLTSIRADDIESARQWVKDVRDYNGAYSETEQLYGFDYSLTDDQINAMSLQELELIAQKSFNRKTRNPDALIVKQQYSTEGEVTTFDLTWINKGLCDARLENGYLVLYANSNEVFRFYKCVDNKSFITDY